MDLNIGLLKAEPGWHLLLDQFGVSYHSEESIRWDEPLIEHYSAMIINGELSDLQFRALTAYVEQGGAILDLGHFLPKLDDFRRGRTFRKSFIPEPTPFYQPSEPIDMYRNIWLHPEGDRFEGSLYWEHRNDAALAFLGWEIADLMLQEQFCYKQFFNPAGKPPYERVSLVSKAEIKRFVFGLLKWLHTSRGIPFVHSWFYPNARKNLFLFRVDTDYGDKSDIMAISDLAKSYELPVSWFLHVEAHLDWLDDFIGLNGDELASHGYSHSEYRRFTPCYENIKQSMKSLAEAGINPKGFAAPYGYWSPVMEQAMAEFDFQYSSEFALAYDHFPFLYSHEATDQQHLQVPVHPICIGSFRKTRASATEMKRYVHHQLEQKITRSEPLVFYHHPNDQHLDVLEHLFQEVRRSEISGTTFREFARWWRKRHSHSFNAQFDTESGELTVTMDRPDTAFSVAVHTEQHHLDLYRSNGDHQLTRQGSIAHEPVAISKAELEPLRGFKPRLIKQSLLDRFHRIRS